MKRTTLALAAALALTGCDQLSQRLGIDDPAQKEAKAEAEGRAVGSACRQSGRAIEDCYSVYRWLPKAAIFSGWKEMNDYMQANNLEVVEPKLPPAPPPEDKRKKNKIIPPEGTTNGEEKKAEADGGGKPAEKSAEGGKTESAAKPEEKAAKH